MPQLPRSVGKARAAQLREKGAERLVAYLASEVGRRREVLVEEDGIGRTEGFAKTAIDAPPGRMVAALITGHDGERLLARPVEEAPARGRADTACAGREPAAMSIGPGDGRGDVSIAPGTPADVVRATRVVHG
jgi:hypothetical protein